MIKSFSGQVAFVLLFAEPYLLTLAKTDYHSILFHLRDEKLGAPWFLTAGFNHILKTLFDNISKISRENPVLPSVDVLGVFTPRNHSRTPKNDIADVTGLPHIP